MFKNLLDPNSEKALSKALDTLDQNIADQRQALIHLIISNQEKLAGSALIEQIKELSTLFELFKQADPKLKPKIENLLSQGLSNETLSNNVEQNKKAFELLNKAITANQHDTIYTLAALSENPVLCEQALGKISLSKQEQLLHESKSEAAKSIIINNLNNIETLKRLEKELKGKDKKTYRILQDKIEHIESTLAKKNALIEKSHKILDSIKKLAQSTYVPLYDSKFKHLESEWQDLQEDLVNSQFTKTEILDANASDDFEKYVNTCKSIIDEVLKEEKIELEKSQTKVFLENSLLKLKSFLSNESVDLEASTHLIASIKDKLNKSTLALKETSFDNQLFLNYDSLFRFHQEYISYLQSPESEKIEQKNKELSELFSSNHKKKQADQSTLASIQSTSNELKNFLSKYSLNKDSLDFEIESLKSLNHRIKSFQTLENQCFAMQNEFQTKFDKKLGYVKTEIENKALSTVIRLCKEAQELLPLCPTKQQEKLQKRLDNYKAEIIKLEDWYNFATLPKRKELCDKIDEVAKNASRTKIKVLKEEIKSLQQQWKELGHARDKESEALWERFQEAGNLAYQPIKDLLDRKDKEKQGNLELREQIIQKLKNHIEQNFSNSAKTNTATQDSDIYNSEKLLRQSRMNWTKAFPIPAGHQKLQNVFDENINLLDEKLKPARTVNLGKKNKLLTQAEKLLELENNNNAIEEAKKLQLEWKEVGYCENDVELWKQFRSTCDRIFEARDSLRNELKEKEKIAISNAKTLCKAIESIDQETVSDFESELRKLCSQFEDIKELPKQRKDLQNNFLKAKKSARSRLDELKRNHKSQDFKNILSICESLASIEKEIISGKLSLDEIETQFETDCNQYNCPTEAKDKLKDSVIALYMALKQDINSHITQQSDALRQLCVELEIELDIDSPAKDKALRMELQVKRLNKKFNQSDKELSIAEKILSAFYLGGLNSFQDPSYVSRLVAMQEKMQ